MAFNHIFFNQNTAFGAMLRRMLQFMEQADDRYEYTGLGEVRGQELDADGRVYLVIANPSWASGQSADPVIAVFR